MKEGFLKDKLLLQIMKHICRFSSDGAFKPMKFGVFSKINGGKTEINVMSLNCFCLTWLKQLSELAN